MGIELKNNFGVNGCPTVYSHQSMDPPLKDFAVMVHALQCVSFAVFGSNPKDSFLAVLTSSAIFHANVSMSVVCC